MTTHHPDRITPAIALVLEELVIDGAMDKDLAERLHCSTGNVKSHLHGARAVSGTTTRTGLALWWVRTGRYEYLRQQQTEETEAA